MNVLRLTTITLSLTLLVACGGGGGGGGTPAAGGGGGGPQVRLEELPNLLIPESDVAGAIVIATGTVPGQGNAPGTPPAASDLEMKVVEIAGRSDGLLFSEMAAVGDLNASRMFTCTHGMTMCAASIDDGTGNPVEEMIAPEEIDGPFLFQNDLVGYNDSYSFVMIDGGADDNLVPLVQVRAAGRDDAGVRFAYQGYGGWLEHSVFVVQHQSTTFMGAPASSIAAYSFGDATGTNPTGELRWDGVMIGRTTDSIIQGDVTIQVEPDSPNHIGGLFNNIKNISDGGDYMSGLITWNNIPLADGAFTSEDAFRVGTGSISGYLYGPNHTEVGGIFNVGELFGAFGAKKR